MITTFDINEVANKIEVSMGDDLGLEALILAIDKGYSLRQIVDAIMNDRLEEDGNLFDELGNIEYPEDLPPEIINKSLYVQTTSQKYDIEEIKKYCVKQSLDLDVTVFYLLLKLLDIGYSPEQVFSAIYLGTIQRKEVYPYSTDGLDDDHDPDYRWMIVDDQGKRIAPANTPKGIFSSFMIKEGTYQLYAHMRCLLEQALEEAWTNTLIVEVKKEEVTVDCPEVSWDVKYDLNCSGTGITDEIWVFESDMTWEKTEFASCGWEGDWYMLGNEIQLATNVFGCWYTGTVNEDCTKIEGDGYFEEWHDCWTAIKRQ